MSPIKTVGIIGGGPSGISALYELTHTLNDGSSIVGQDHLKFKGQLAFDNVVLFERNSTIGGTWAKSECGKLEREPNLPVLSENNYDKPQNCFKKFKIPEQIEKHTFGEPLIVENPDFNSVEYKNQWKSSGVYDGLFTNIPYNYMSFSFTDDIELPKRILKTLQPWEEVSQYLESVVVDNALNEYIRYDSAVEKIYKKDDKWIVVVRLVEDHKEKWYQQEFDALVIANGKSVPHIPLSENLREYQLKYPDVIQHCKNISSPQNLQKKKKILFIGSGISTVDLIQYCYPREDNTIFISRRSPANKIDWVNYASYSSGIVGKPEIKKFVPETNSIEFVDGSVESNFDSIIYGTGYHKYFPFLEEFELETGENYHEFYKHVFCKKDPTLALVGTLYAAFFFNRAEASSSAIAGVWSGFRELPSAEVQKQSVEVDQYAVWNIKTDFIEALVHNYAPKGRKSPFDSKSRKDPIRDYAEGFRTIGQLFTDLKEGKIAHNEVFRILE